MPSSFEGRDFRNPGNLRDFSDELNIDTPEQVDLAYSVAGLGSRFVALLLDSLIIFGFYMVALVALALIYSGAARMGARLDAAGKWATALFIFLNFLLLWGYFSLFEAFWRGQTPGKRAMKLRVIKDSGRQITFFESLARNVLRLVDFLPGMYLAGVITMLCNQRNKRLGDFAAGTIVIHERAEEQPLLMHIGGATAANTAVGSGWRAGASSAERSHTAEPWRQPAELRREPAELWRRPAEPMFPADAVARLDGHDLVVLETFFARMLDLPSETRAAVADRIAGQLAAKMAVPLPPGNPERAMEAMAYQMRSSGRTH